MAISIPTPQPLLLLLLAATALSILLQTPPTAAQIHNYDWSAAASSTDAMSVYQGDNTIDFQDLMGSYSSQIDTIIDDDIEDDDSSSDHNRRSLFWKHTAYYISYGALSANRVPCPPRSGRSYYTHNCFRARGQAHPYTRGCSAIARCRR